MRRHDIYYKKSRYNPILKDNMDRLATRLSKYGIAYPDIKTSNTFKRRMRQSGNLDIVQVSRHPDDDDRRIVTLKSPYCVKKINNTRIRIEKK